jgi:hypothetical protein
MRTTLDIADDVLSAAKALGRRERKSIGQVISELARAALLSSGSQDDSGDEFLGFRPLPPRGVVVTNELIDKLREDEFI